MASLPPSHAVPWAHLSTTPRLQQISRSRARALRLHRLQAGNAEFRNAREAMSSPLATRLFGIDGVTGAFFGSDFVTVSLIGDPHARSGRMLWRRAGRFCHPKRER